MHLTETATVAVETAGPRRHGLFWFILLRIPELLLAVVVATLVLFLTVSVISRYVFDVGIPWSDEAARVMFVWLVYVGFAVGVRHRGNIGVDWWVEKFPAPLKRSVHIFQDIVIFLFSAFFLWESVTTLRFSFIQRLPALQISIAWLYAAIVVAGVLMTIYAAANAMDSLRKRTLAIPEAGVDAAANSNSPLR